MRSIIPSVQSALKRALLVAVLWLLVTTSFAEDPYWAAKYPRFGGGKSPARLETVTHRFFTRTVLRKLSVDTKSVPDAFEQVRTVLRRAHAEFGLGCTMTHLDYPGYSRPCRLHARRIALATVIDRLAAQGDLFWDFSAGGALAFYPPKSFTQ